jgi:multiple sugar transport system ATP-binding protein
MAEVVLRSLVKEFPGGVRAIDRLDLHIADGEFFALLGPSGCGKTTLLRTIAGLEAPTGGTVEIGGRDVTRAQPGRRDVAMVFQDYALYPHMTVVDNIAYPLKVKRVPKAERHRTAAEAGASLQLEATMDRRPGQLSGGQQQRVALARAIAYRPKVFLFDEPLSNLDARLRLEARTFLKRLQHELGTTTVYVTHDQSEALALADRMAVMEAGRIRQLGTPVEVFRRPANLFVAGFIGSTPMNLLEATVDGGLRVGRARLPLPPGAEPHLGAGQRVVVGIRPEYAALADAERPGAIAGKVVLLESLGSAFLVSVEGDGVRAQVTVPEGRQPAVGDQAFVVPDPERLLVYGHDDGELIGTTAQKDGTGEGDTAHRPAGHGPSS